MPWRFQFLDPGVLRDGELELVAPRPELVEQVVRSEPDGRADRVRAAALAMATAGGRERGAPLGIGGIVPAYHFWMRLHATADRGVPPVPIAGGIGLRIGTTRDLRLYGGHVGYHVHRPARGHSYAARSLTLLLPLAKAHGLKELFVTANPDNVPSRRSIEKAGGEYLETVRVPRRHPLHRRGEPLKARYRIGLT